jgi:hypothetical protein
MNFSMSANRENINVIMRRDSRVLRHERKRQEKFHHVDQHVCSSTRRAAMFDIGTTVSRRAISSFVYTL